MIQLRKPLLSQVEAAMMMTMSGVMLTFHTSQFQRKTGNSGSFPLTPTPTPLTHLVAKPYQ